MIRIGLLPKLMKLLTQDDGNKTTILGLLYHASIDDKVKTMFTNTEFVPLVCLRESLIIIILFIYVDYKLN